MSAVAPVRVGGCPQCGHGYPGEHGDWCPTQPMPTDPVEAARVTFHRLSYAGASDVEVKAARLALKQAEIDAAYQQHATDGRSAA